MTNGYAANACEANLVGDGTNPSPLIEDSDLRDRVQRLWLAWTDEADADGLTDFYGLQAMVPRKVFVAGECFVRLRPRRAEDGLLVPLQMQLLQAEMLPFEKTETAANGNRIRCGIEFDAIGVAWPTTSAAPIPATARTGAWPCPRPCVRDPTAMREGAGHQNAVAAALVPGLHRRAYRSAVDPVELGADSVEVEQQPLGRKGVGGDHVRAGSDVVPMDAHQCRQVLGRHGIAP